jgi:cytochrome b561
MEATQFIHGLGPAAHGKQLHLWTTVHHYLGQRVPIAALVRSPWRCLMATQAPAPGPTPANSQGLRLVHSR